MVCLENANLEQAIVVCKHLGFPGAERPLYKQELEEPFEMTKLKIYQCYGHENSLLECHYDFLDPLSYLGSPVGPCPNQGGVICHASKFSIECII